MEIKLTLLIFIFSLSATLNAQREVIDLHINKNKSEVVVLSDSVFYIEKKNNIIIKYKGDGRISHLKIEGGKAKKHQQNSYEITFPNETTDKVTFLKIYEKTAKGKQQLIYTKVFSLAHIPKPIISIGGVRNDSALNIEHLIRDNYVRSFHPISNNQLVVHSFTIHFSAQDSVRIKGGRIPLSIKGKLHNLSEGRTLKLTNVFTYMPDNTLYNTREIQVFLIKTNQYLIGR